MIILTFISSDIEYTD